MLHEVPWESIAEQLASVSQVRPALGPLVTALEPLLALVHREAQAAVPPQISLVEPEVRNGIGLPILPRAEFPVNAEAGLRLFRQLLAGAVQAGETGEVAIPLREQAEDPRWVEGILQAYVAGNLETVPSQRETAHRSQQLGFFAGLALLPGVEAAAGSLGWRVSSAWSMAFCPVCGTRPRVAELRAPEGRRYLHCGFCGWAWAYPRTGCPLCGTTDHHAMEVLLVEDDPRVKVETCRSCRRYLKLVDNHELFGLIPFIEDLTTPHLELLALQRGYR